MGKKRLTEMYESESSDDNQSDEELQAAFARGDLKPGLNIESTEKIHINNVPKMIAKLDEIRLNLPWLERLDMINGLAPLAPELEVQMEKHEQKRSNEFKGNAKLKKYEPEDDPVLNDFKREMYFHRQAQTAVLEGIKRLHELNIPTKRPDDYFAEMAKTDEHMQKVRSNLIAKQAGQARSERIKQIRDQRKMGKVLAKQSKVKREMEKKDMLDSLKKFRKGKLKNLDFLEDGKNMNSKKKELSDKRKLRDQRFGFGGKKRGMKRNTKGSSMGTEKVKQFTKTKARSGANKRLGKSRRRQSKNSKK